MVPALWIAALLVTAEAGARRLLPRVPGCLETHRNPYRFRGWPEYTDGLQARKAGERVLVLLGNSQAYAGEYPVQVIYANQLEDLLNARRAGGTDRWRVVNWSADGMQTTEHQILARQLALHPPDLVLAVTGFADYSPSHARQGYLYCRTDVPRLATRPSVWTGLPARHLKNHWKTEDFLTFLIQDCSALWRVREYGWCWADTRARGAIQGLYAPNLNYQPWEITVPRDRKKVAWNGVPPSAAAHARPPGGAGDPIVAYAPGVSAPMLEDYLGLLSRIGCPVILVSQPRQPIHDAGYAESDRRFMEDITAGAARYRMTLWDAREALPAERFITSSHFHSSNHDRFAVWLADHLCASPEVTVSSSTPPHP